MKRFYITTSIAYVNSAPHIGYALELIQADVIARYRRQLGDVVFFATGTDEHGIKIARRAEEFHQNPREFVDTNAALFKDLRQLLDLSWDVFVRTTDRKKHWPVAIEMWNALYKKGDLYRKLYEGLYCVGHEAFVTGKDLQDGVCSIHKTKPEVLKEENWFFRFSKYRSAVRKLLQKGTIKIIPEGRRREMLAFVREKTDDVSFSRPRKDLSWGIPVPGDETQTMYVWADALTNYLSALDWANKKSPLKKFWPADVHVIGKDIARFHALLWPAMLLSANIKLPKIIFVHGFINRDGEKMSKSLGNVIDPKELVQKYGADAVRYYLLREIPATEDGDFSVEKFEARYNGDLANGLGNLVARVAALGQRISPLPYTIRAAHSEIKTEIQRSERRYIREMKEFRLNQALGEAWRLIGFADRFINDTKPWKETDQKKLGAMITQAAFMILAIEKLIRPFLPEASEKIRKQFCVERGRLSIKKGASLFPRL